jgi:hypothetical protein
MLVLLAARKSQKKESCQGAIQTGNSTAINIRRDPHSWLIWQAKPTCADISVLDIYGCKGPPRYRLTTNQQLGDDEV